MNTLRHSWTLLICCLPVLSAAAESDNSSLDTVEVSATRLRGVPDIDVPASVATVRMSPDDNQPQVEVTELLSGIPGVTALDRQNYAQDTQLSIRGFGARATFGVRGLRLYADGIPASMPDGQGQVSHFSMMGADRIQVMRGPFSALYGNSSGGVVQIWSKPGEEGDPTRLRATYGSFDTWTLGAQTLGKVGLMDYNIALSHFDTGGYRDHSAAERTTGNVRLGFDIGERRSLSLVVNVIDLPDAQDPLGLTVEDWRADPQQATAVAEQFNTRKSVSQTQGGLVFEQGFGEAQTLRLMGYYGNRAVEQFLAIPATAQVNALHSGGNVVLDSDYYGGDARWNWQGTFGSMPAELTVGVNTDRQRQLRRGYENFVGAQLGVRGAIRRNEINTVSNFDQFAQLWLQLTDRWSLLAGARHSKVTFDSDDRYIVGTNPDDSGRKSYSDTAPVAGVMFHPIESLRAYASIGKGFETPTFNELSYRADGGAGLAFDLKPAVSRNYELGVKWRPSSGVAIDAALFQADTDDELAVARNTGGRSSYRNVGAARRRGFETSVNWPLAQHWNAELAYTWLDASFTSNYLICVVAGCTVPDVTVPSGSPIPGVPEHEGLLRVNFTPNAWTLALEATGSAGLVANDNATVASPGYVIFNAEAGRSWEFGNSQLRVFTRLENLLDRKYVGSVIVNEGNSRFFESGPDFSAMIGAQWSWR
ncbi:MAG: TonB-dependent receptor [Nevskiaceae bacterium]|jgi:iron complex outermembrane receptor protein|nr:TonB-dependent receptor [Nevskiaceae bacterium]